MGEAYGCVCLCIYTYAHSTHNWVMCMFKNFMGGKLKIWQTAVFKGSPSLPSTSP